MHPLSGKYISFWLIHAVRYVTTFFDCTADLVGQLNGNGQKGMLQTDAPPVENFWLRHCNWLLTWTTISSRTFSTVLTKFCTNFSRTKLIIPTILDIVIILSH